MNLYRGSRGRTPLFCNLGSEWLASRSGRLIPGKESRYLLTRSVSGPQSLSGGFGCPYRDSNPGPSSPQNSCYTDCAKTREANQNIFFINHFHYLCLFSKYINFLNDRVFHNCILRCSVRVFRLYTYFCIKRVLYRMDVSQQCLSNSHYVHIFGTQCTIKASLT